jgi:hypothetical protein
MVRVFCFFDVKTSMEGLWPGQYAGCAASRERIIFLSNLDKKHLTDRCIFKIKQC